jgi:hypothetical protein
MKGEVSIRTVCTSAAVTSFTEYHVPDGFFFFGESQGETSHDDLPDLEGDAADAMLVNGLLAVSTLGAAS